MKVLKLGLWWFPETKSFFMSVGNPSEIGIRANLFNMFLFTQLAVLADLEPILGAFLGGVIFSKLFAEREEMLERLSAFGYGFLIPLFFIEVGTRFEFSNFASYEVIKGGLILSAAILAVRVFASIPLLFADIPKKYLIYIPFGESLPLTLLVAVATVGESGGLINQTQLFIIILTAVFTSIVYPSVIKIIYRFIPVTE